MSRLVNSMRTFFFFYENFMWLLKGFYEVSTWIPLKSHKGFTFIRKKYARIL